MTVAVDRELGEGATGSTASAAPTTAKERSDDCTQSSSKTLRRLEETQQPHRCVALYKFVPLPTERDEDDDDGGRDLPLASLRDEIEALCLNRRARGCLILAPEGINGTVCLPDGDDCDRFLHAIRSHRYFGDCDGVGDGVEEGSKTAMRLRLRVGPPSTGQVFARLKVKRKNEIVTMGCCHGDGGGDGTCGGDRVRCTVDTVGKYVPPSEWNALLTDPDVLVVDTRNDYEMDIGTFEHAVRPDITCFRDFPSWLEGYLQSQKSYAEGERPSRPRKCAMFCTGGIRCEKATSYAATRRLFDEVYHLEGGILAYLDSIPETQSLWRGECFVFDDRISVGTGLRPTGTYTRCHACRRYISREDRDREDFVDGVSCRYCVGTSTEDQKRGYAERQLQVELAERDGGRHMFDPKSDGADRCHSSARG